MTKLLSQTRMTKSHCQKMTKSNRKNDYFKLTVGAYRRQCSYLEIRLNIIETEHEIIYCRKLSSRFIL